jgi:hypothetical protein
MPEFKINKTKKGRYVFLDEAGLKLTRNEYAKAKKRYPKYKTYERKENGVELK